MLDDIEIAKNIEYQESSIKAGFNQNLLIIFKFGTDDAIDYAGRAGSG